MAVSELISQALRAVKSNAPEILTAMGISGLASTSYLAAKGGYKAAQIMSDKDPYMSDKEKIKTTWKCYIPAALSGFATITCIVGAGRANGQRTAAAVAAYSFTERMFSEYKEKVVETIGESKEQKLRDNLAQDRVTANPPGGSREVIMVGKGDVLCYEMLTDRYFKSDIETLRKAQNDINYLVNAFNYVSLSEFYDLIGLPHTGVSDHQGWNFEKQMELRFSYTGAPDGEPCLAFEYNYVKPLT